jgi:hypothetical protein
MLTIVDARSAEALVLEKLIKKLESRLRLCYTSIMNNPFTYKCFDASSFWLIPKHGKDVIPPDLVIKLAIESTPEEVKQAIQGLFFENVGIDDMTEGQSADALVINAVVFLNALTGDVEPFMKEAGIPPKYRENLQLLQKLSSGTPTSAELNEMFMG